MKQPPARRWGTWRNRAGRAEGRAAALEAMFERATGTSPALYSMAEVGRAFLIRPDMNVRMTNIKVPPQESHDAN